MFYFPFDRYQPVEESSRFTAAVAELTGWLVDVYQFFSSRLRSPLQDAIQVGMYPRRLGFQVEGAGKLRIFAIPNAVKQSLLRPAHEWCMQVLRLIPQDGTFNQLSPLFRITPLSSLCFLPYQLRYLNYGTKRGLFKDENRTQYRKGSETNQYRFYK